MGSTWFWNGAGRLKQTFFALLITATIPSAHPGLGSESSSFWLTNGPGVFRATLQFQTNIVPRGRVYAPPPTNLPPELRRALYSFLNAQQTGTELKTLTNLVFDHYVPESLNHLVWTNVIAHTNGKNMLIWTRRVRPPGWPKEPPQAAWNHQSLIWCLRGFTALSPSWEGEGSPGQIPITALTRRHGYTRGHDMGPDGFHTTLAGKKVWFLTKDDKIVERTIKWEVVRTIRSNVWDYTILLFNKDLPESIQPMRVTHYTNLFSPGPTRYRFLDYAPVPLFKTEQGGYVSADLPGLTVPTWKGGDSGSPNMLPLPGELLFTSGRSTSGATAAMQADIDELCRREGLNPAKYRLEWVDLSRFPAY